MRHELQKNLYLLPGFHGSPALFGPLVSHLSSAIEAHPLAFESADSLTDHVEQVSGLLPAENAFLLAESFSGPIALSLMAQQPKRFRGAVLSCTFARSPLLSLVKLGRRLPTFAFRQNPLKKSILKYFCLNRTDQPALLSTVLNAVAAVPASAIKSRLNVLAETDLRRNLAQISAPILCLAASHDRVVPRRLVTELRDLLPNANLEILEGPHLLLQARPQQAAAAVSTFINSV